MLCREMRESEIHRPNERIVGQKSKKKAQIFEKYLYEFWCLKKKITFCAKRISDCDRFSFLLRQNCVSFSIELTQ